MTYNINLTNGDNLVSIGENVIDSDTVSGLGLIGKLTPNYGETQSENFVHIVENFASNEVFPTKALMGQICYIKSHKGLYVCINNDYEIDDDGVFATGSEEDYWVKLPSVIYKSTKPTVANGRNGYFWFDTVNKALYVYDELKNDYINVNNQDYNNIDEQTSIKYTVENVAPTFTYDFDVKESNALGLFQIDMNIMAREEGVDDEHVGSWTIKSLVVSKMVNNVLTREHRASSSNAFYLTPNLNWGVSASMADNKFVVTLNGSNSEDTSNIKWFVEIKVRKC